MNNYPSYNTHAKISLFKFLYKYSKELKVNWEENKIVNTCLNGDYVYLLHQGKVNIVRNLDFLVICTLYDSDIIGLLGMWDSNSRYHFTFEKGTRISFISGGLAMSLIEKNDYWYHLSITLADRLNKLSIRDGILLRTRVIDVIIGFLIEISHLPTDFKSETKVVDYISERCIISTRTIQKVLKKLEEEGSIKIETGILKEVFCLPCDVK